MSLAFDCPSCSASLRVNRLHRGRQVTCRDCGAAVDVPATLDFSRFTDAALDDRRAASRLLLASVLSSMACLVPVSAGVWFLASRRIGLARQQERPVQVDLRKARVIAAVSTVSHLVFYVMVAKDVF